MPHLNLDGVHWDNEHFNHKRDEDVARRMTAEAAAQERWIIEGVYGWLAAVALPRATALIWLDMPWDYCRSGLLVRGAWRGIDEAAFQEFLAWAEAYYSSRTTSSSLVGHARLFDDRGQEMAPAKPRRSARIHDGRQRVGTGLSEL